MEPFKFKRWSNRKHAVLSSFHKVIHIGTLSLACGMLNIQPAFCQSDTASPQIFYTLEEVETSSEQSAELYAESLRQIISVTPQQIQQLSSRSLHEILDYAPGVDIRTRGVNGIQSDLSILGSSFDQSMVLINGIDFSDPQTGHFSLDLPITASGTKQIEILKGPASKKYGNNAYAGAVNFITTPSDSLNFNGQVNCGHYGSYLASGSVHLPLKNIKTMISAYSSGSNGYTDVTDIAGTYIANTDYKQHGAYLHSVLKAKHSKTESIIGWNKKDFGANTFYTPKYPDQYEETSSILTALKFSSHKINANIHWRRHYDHFILFRENPSWYENYHMTDLIGSSIGGKYSSIFGVSSAKMIYRFEQIYSTTLGNAINETRKISDATEKEFTKYDNRQHFSLSLNHMYQKGKFMLDAGLLLKAGISGISEKGIYPGIDLSWKMSEEMYFRSSINRSMRLPTFTDLYYQGPQNLGNPNLKPETAWTVEEGLTFKKKQVELQASAYFRKGIKSIDWIWKDSLWQTENLTELNSWGAELSFRYLPSKVNPNAFIQSLGVHYSFNEITKANDEIISHYVLDYLKHKFIAEASFRITEKLNLHINNRIQDRNGSYSWYETPDSEPLEREYMAFMLTDLMLSCNIKSLTFFVNATNIFNVEYRDIGSVLMPGRIIQGGIKFNI